jgi:hypothetical protein
VFQELPLSTSCVNVGGYTAEVLLRDIVGQGVGCSRAGRCSEWGREPQTVRASLGAAHQLIKSWQKVDLSPKFPALGPFSAGDSLGFGVAVAMLLKSLEPGRHSQITNSLKLLENFVQATLTFLWPHRRGCSAYVHLEETE